MKYFWLAIGLCVALPAAPAPGPEEDAEALEIQRTQALIEAGALPERALSETRRELERERLLARSRELAMKTSLSLHEASELLRATARLREMIRTDFVETSRRIEAGALPAKLLHPAKEQLESAEKQYELAEKRARLTSEMAAMASAERRFDELEEDEMAFSFDGAPDWESGLAEVEHVFAEEFGRALPISAVGDTELHRSLGLDHTGRYDIALHPDEVEGEFLIILLESWGVPYIAFRSAVPGHSTGPHIHIGPPSPRIEPQDELDQILYELLSP